MRQEYCGPVIDACVATIVDNADALTALDAAVGDGDHGLNMRRGFEAISEIRDELCTLEPGEALKKAGMTLVMKVGGASGPLYGSALMAMGKADGNTVERLRAGVEAVAARGKSQRGEKTMLDVLFPVLEALEAGADSQRVRGVADEALESTRDMLATKGRASFLGARSVGHLDPGARSSCLLVHAVCDAIEASA